MGNSIMGDEKYQEEMRMLLNILKEQAKAKGITEQQIADKTGFIQSNVNRMFAGKYSPLLDNFLELADAVGYHIELKENQ
jgi:transcriptional regulator with XRE-family HTH domain